MGLRRTAMDEKVAGCEGVARATRPRAAKLKDACFGTESVGIHSPPAGGRRYIFEGADPGRERSEGRGKSSDPFLFCCTQIASARQTVRIFALRNGM